MASESRGAIILFDGVCGLCNASVDFVLKRDRAARFKFGSLQSESGARLLKEHGLEQGSAAKPAETMVLIDQGKVYSESSAALRVALRLPGIWPVFAAIGLCVPTLVRDSVYRLIARNRYRWFGKLEQCRLPTAEERARFI